jgi:class 3 adenylate cyclase
MGMLAAYTLEHAARRDFLLTRLLEQEREKSERLLLNILPETIADRLKQQPGTVADSFPDVTVLFADIVDFTPLSAHLTAEGTVALLNDVFSCFDGLAEKHGLEKIKTIGDAYMVVGGLPEPHGGRVQAVLAMAIDMQREIRRFHRETGEPLSLRIGINTGPVVAGVIGAKKFSYDLWGETVNLASRMETYGVAGGIQVTAAAHERLLDHYRFTARTLLNVKGKGAMTVYLLDAAKEA